MKTADFVARLGERGSLLAIVGHRGRLTYAELANSIQPIPGLPRGSIVALRDDHSPAGITRLLSLWLQGCIVAPLTATAGPRYLELVRTLQTEYIIRDGEIEATGVVAQHPLYDQLRALDEPGLVLFTSGSTGQPKAVVHRIETTLAKIAKSGKAHRTLAFLGFDHIGGQNTMLYCLMHGGSLVTTETRDPDEVAHAIAVHRVELLPTSPSFLRLFLLTRAYRRHKLHSLKLITYGSEPMPPQTLAQLDQVLPEVRKQQQFGMSEIGVLRSQSKGNASTWVKLGGDEFELRIVDGCLEIRAETAMLGYLNAPSPFTEDGWLRTGDLVEQDGEWFRILGRASEVINVGGEKVHPAEVESVIEELDGVTQAVVRGEPNPILGQIVTASVRLKFEESEESIRRRVRAHCAEHLPRHMVPQKVRIIDSATSDIKKKRAA